MAFVFYDLETSGTNTRFDQILQFAAVRTDADLAELERIDLRCRLDRHIVPHPEALVVTRRTIAQIIDPRLPSHYAMMCTVARLLEEWSPAVFVGFNSIRFDEEMLRHALYRTLHDPYLTSRPGNVRADALTLARAMAFFNPGCIKVPSDGEGKPCFRLGLLNEANGGPDTAAHTGIGDVEAMLFLCRQIQRQDPASWSRFLQYAPKKSVAALLDQGGPFGIVRFRGNDARPTAMSQLGGSSDPNRRYCLDLLCDIDRLAESGDNEVAAQIASSMSPVFRVRVNACPCVCEIWDLPAAGRNGLDDAELEARAARVASDPRLGDRLIAAARAGETAYPRSDHVEARLYDALPDADDELVRRFHAARWTERQPILDRMTDKRWRSLGNRLVYLEAPETLDPGRLRRLDAAVLARRHAAAGEKPWTTVHDAAEWFSRSSCDVPAELLSEFEAIVAEIVA